MIKALKVKSVDECGMGDAFLATEKCHTTLMRKSHDNIDVGISNRSPKLGETIHSEF